MVLLDERAAGSSAPPAQQDRLAGARLPEELARRTYRAYRRRQAAELLRLLPSGAARPLYAKARGWARSRGVHDEKDPMSTLLRYCEHILPLPPFRDWIGDASRNPDAHVRQLERRPDGEPATDSFPVEVRSFEEGGVVWYATLSLYRAGDAWRGFIAFHRGPDTPVFRTAEIFREESAAEVRSRFRTFEPPALEAFLRSVRPQGIPVR